MALAAWPQPNQIKKTAKTPGGKPVQNSEEMITSE